MRHHKEFHYVWEYDFAAAPEAVWSFIADTNRFNMDAGVPPIEVSLTDDEILVNNRRRLQLRVFGKRLEWEEEPFEWIRPLRFSVVRRYLNGPVAEMRVQATLTSREAICSHRDAEQSDKGTHLVYEVTARPRNLLGRLAIPAQISVISKRQFRREFARYKRLTDVVKPQPPRAPRGAETQLTPESEARLVGVRTTLLARNLNAQLVDQLVDTIRRADELTLARLQPRALAAEWGTTDRRAVLELCLHATRAGLLELRWELLCPLCRGAKASYETLGEVNPQVHCDTCRIDFRVDFDRSVEITFRPSPAIRRVEHRQFCVGGPEVTPHIVAQQLLVAGERRELTMRLETGRYRVRSPQIPADTFITIEEGGSSEATLCAKDDRWVTDEASLSDELILNLFNATAREQLFIFERVRWSDTATTAAEVTALQTFRDLFSREALRPGEQISVGQITILFTDLRDSTRFYREVGDAPAFRRVMSHFDVLRACVAEEDGGIVKTIGDAVMAVFQCPASALRAVIKAQTSLAAIGDKPPLRLKAGIHTGACIAVTLNDRLDYFGSTVNFAARLVGLSSGDDCIISQAVYTDPAVINLLTGSGENLIVEPRQTSLRGFDTAQFNLWTVRRGAPKTSVQS